MKPVNADAIQAHAEYLRWVRERANPASRTPAEAHLVVMADVNDNLIDALRRSARLLEAMFGSAKIQWTDEQRAALKQHYGEAMQAIAIAEGRA